MAAQLMPTSTFEKIQQIQIHKPRLWSISSVRFETAILISLSTIVFGLMRTSLGMAMVDIVDRNETTDPMFHMDWNTDEQARIHTSFYIGAFASVFPAEYLTQKFGAKQLITYGLLTNAIGSIATIFVAIYLRSYIPVLAIRFIMGFGFGLMIPAGAVLITKWFPMDEKSTAMAIFTTGNQVGISASLFLTAKLCQLPYFNGWPFAFGLYGIIGLLFLIVWVVRIADKPRQSKYITATELMYIQGGKARRNRSNTVVRPTPYRKILLNGCVFGICACSFAQSFVIVALITYLPKFNQIAMKMNMTNNGIWSSLPFIVQMITKLLFAVIADRVKQCNVDVTTVTKASNALASFGSAIFIIIAASLPLEYIQLIQISITCSMALFSAYVPGYNTSIVTVAPQFTAFISAYGQMYSQVASTLAPILIGRITRHDTAEEWKIAFYSLAGILIVTGLIFQIFGHGRTESWGETPSNATSLRLSTCTINDDGQRKLSLLERHNTNLLSEPQNGVARKKVSRVSYADEEIALPARLEDLENDVIEEENGETA
ncbi:unnamed protein product [Caenorhabditis bovis]|uniref:Major facilitator superfamily (MFS) profile domain-containing protein n=1 Tax=Caenorhabditis bovis TaxID=2654633 RepID=A0A8S1F7D1_9PELO|nr:unnamed protein product [Caenorhabditis bovis]